MIHDQRRFKEEAAQILRAGLGVRGDPGGRCPVVEPDQDVPQIKQKSADC